MINNAVQQTLDFIQYSLIFGEFDSERGERSCDKPQDETAADCSGLSSSNGAKYSEIV